MPNSIEKHKVSVTIATVVLCCIFISTLAYNVGAKQNKISEDVEHLKSGQVKCEERAEKQEEVNKEFTKAVIEIKGDVKHIRETLEELKNDK